MALSDVLDHPEIYALWQAPFRRAKVQPFVRRNQFTKKLRVLDVGCGPGTNATLFADHDYLGIDLSAHYIQRAQTRFGPHFQQADATTFNPPEGAEYDVIFLNSLMHHLPDDLTVSMLQRLTASLAPTGRLHILDLVLPERSSLSRWLALQDRGHYARSLTAWRTLFETVFAIDLFEPYPVRRLGLTFWQMVYCRGSRRDS